MGAKNLEDLKNLVKKQIINEHKVSLDSITKKNILEKIEKVHTLDLPQNLIDQEIKLIEQGQKKEDLEKNRDKNINFAKSRIKIGLILNEIAEKNNLKVGESEIKNEIEKQIKSMPGQEKMVMDYYQKNPSAVASLRGAIYEEKIIDLIKKQITLIKKTISSKEALEILNSLNKKTQAKMATEKPKKQQKKSKIKTKK
jgi:FKBP-type peptidyl-prolyl cis-trans isomerase (trigger factor)